MKSKKLYLWILILSIAGTLFAGTLAYRKYVQNVCSFRESCPIFLGQPVCIYGFIIFLALLVLSLLVYRLQKPAFAIALLVVSMVGVLFSGYFAIQEVFFTLWPIGGYTLVLPSCVWGFVVFVAVFVLNIFAYRMK
jgi:uncharacterized membrane protein